MKKIAWIYFLISWAALGAEETTLKTIGSLETRPSWDSLTGVFRTENSVEAGIQLNKNLSLSYLQAINTNIYNPQEPVSNKGLNATLDVGYLRTRVNNIWSNESGLSLSYQNRIYLPVNETAQKNENFLTMRNYFTLSQKASDTVKFTVSEIPILFVNGRAGVGESANSVFENRVYLIADFQLSSKLSLSLPLMFHQTRKANYLETAANNNRWVHFAWINPELSYSLDDHYSLGFAYYNNESLIASDLSSFQIGKGLENGTYQFVLGASL